MVDTIKKLLEAGDEEGKCAGLSASSFSQISEIVSAVKDHTAVLDDLVEKLAQSNKKIVESVQTASAVTEEVTAHANQTYSASESNQSIVRNVNDIVGALSRDAQTLREQGQTDRWKVLARRAVTQPTAEALMPGELWYNQPPKRLWLTTR